MSRPCSTGARGAGPDETNEGVPEEGGKIKSTSSWGMHLFKARGQTFFGSRDIGLFGVPGGPQSGQANPPPGPKIEKKPGWSIQIGLPN